MLAKRAAAAALIALLLVGGGCRHKHRAPSLPARTYRMGFSWFPPRPELPLALEVIDAFRPHADCALILVSPPWTQLLAGADAATLVAGNELGLANHYRDLGLPIVVSIDPTNGFDRSADAPELEDANRSLAEPAVQQLFVDYAVAMATQLQPDYLSLASETNLVRARAQAPLYDGLRAAANTAAATIAPAAPAVHLFVTVQVEVAWGLPGSSFVGIGDDLAAFPFTTAIGASSFPYLAGIADPEDLPADYFSRIAAGTDLPLLVIEGGWPSVAVAGITSDAAEQSRYVARAADLLDMAQAIAWFQISFTDLDVAAYSADVVSFADLGMVTTTLDAKPALTGWDAEFARPRR